MDQDRCFCCLSMWETVWNFARCYEGTLLWSSKLLVRLVFVGSYPFLALSYALEDEAGNPTRWVKQVSDVKNMWSQSPQIWILTDFKGSMLRICGARAARSSIFCLELETSGHFTWSQSQNTFQELSNFFMVSHLGDSAVCHSLFPPKLSWANCREVIKNRLIKK